MHMSEVAVPDLYSYVSTSYLQYLPHAFSDLEVLAIDFEDLYSLSTILKPCDHLHPTRNRGTRGALVEFNTFLALGNITGIFYYILEVPDARYCPYILAQQHFKAIN